MPTVSIIAEVNDVLPSLLNKLKYANHGLSAVDALNVAETLGQLRCMILIHRMHGVMNIELFTRWCLEYRPVFELLQRAEIVTDGKEETT